MRGRHVLFCSASLLVLAPAAHAQTAPIAADKAASDDDSRGPGSRSTAPIAKEKSTAAVVDAIARDDTADVVVTGLRESIASSENIKRKSDQIVDAIVADDIGKLPDIALSNTAARIPGVQVVRGGGEATQVLVRGLPNVTTTYNGREIFTSNARFVALQDFPASAISALEVYKASTADMVEPGLAGLINVRSRRPFDFKGFQLAASASGNYAYQSGDVTPQGSLLISNRWQTGIGDIGVLLNASYTKLNFLNSNRNAVNSVTNYVGNGQPISLPFFQQVLYSAAERWRPTANGALQWRPTPDIELYVEGLWQGYRAKDSAGSFTVPLINNAGGVYPNLVLKDGTRYVQSGTITNPTRAETSQSASPSHTNTYQGAVGGSYNRDGLKLSFDVARTYSLFVSQTDFVNGAAAVAPAVDFTFDAAGKNGGPSFTPVNFAASDPASYIYRGLYDNAGRYLGKGWQGRFDAAYRIGLEPITLIEAGYRFTDRDTNVQFGERTWNGEALRIPISQLPFDYQMIRAGFRGSDVQPFRSWLAPTYDSVRENLDQLRQLNISRGATISGVAGLGPTAPDPTRTYNASERTIAGYFQVHYLLGDEDGFNVSGVLGLRVARTRSIVAGSILSNGRYTPVDYDNTYYDWLPNGSAKIRFTNKFGLRLSATRTRTRPGFDQLNPSSSLSATNFNCVPDPADPYKCARRGSGGNPYLTPLTSKNYDASLEYYINRGGFMSAAIFQRDLNGFIINQDQNVIDPIFGPVIINRPVNSGRGRIRGAEAQVLGWFDFGPEWLRWFGAQANVTYLDAKTGYPDAMGGLVLDRLPGVSSWTYNLAGLFEHAGFSTRLSYNRRSSFLNQRVQRTNNFRELFVEQVEPISRLDLSVSYSPFKNMTLFTDWTNILRNPYVATMTSARTTGTTSYVRQVVFDETVVSAGIRVRL